ncbi:unnamed protein product [Diatraea saccharalis]|nr:unnamed protein product [Diatraea saccharalis]
MCENTECEYPFGHENVVYVKEDDESQNDEVVSIKSRTVRGTPHDTLSIVSTSAWSEIDNINRVYEAEEQLDQRPEIKEYYLHKRTSRITGDDENQKKLFQNVQEINKLNKELNDSKQEMFVQPQLKNEKWIKNLMSMQKYSGMSLLKPNEMKLVKKTESEIGSGELKIDINMGKDECDMSSVKIEIFNIKEQ